MTWMLMDERGDLVAHYEDAVAAHFGLRTVVDADPEARDALILIEYGEDGVPRGEAITIDDLPLATFNLMEAPPPTFTISISQTTRGISGGDAHAELAFAAPQNVATRGVPAASG